MQLSFLILIFSKKEYHSFHMLQLYRQIDKNKDSRDLILHLAESLTSIARQNPYNEEIFHYFKHLQQLSMIQPRPEQASFVSILLNPQYCHPMQVFCERASEILRQAYKQLKIDALLLIRRELSLKSRLQCDLLLCDIYPDDCQYPLDYAKALIYTKRAIEGMTLLDRKIHYFQNSKQNIKADRLKQFRFIILSICSNQIDPKNLLSYDLFGRKDIFVQLLQIYHETMSQEFSQYVSKDYSQEKDALAFVFLSKMMPEKGIISPEQYGSFLRDVTPEMHFYNLSRFVSLQMVNLFDQAEAYLQKEMTMRKSRDLYTRASNFYFMIGKYQLCLDYTFRLNMYVEKPCDCNLMMALCYLKLNQHEKALPIIQAAQDNKDDRNTMGLLLSYHRLGQPFKVIDLGWKFINDGMNLPNILVIKIKILILINYQKVKLPIRDFISDIVRHFSKQKVRFGYLNQQFSVFRFMCELSYNSQDRQIFKLRQNFVGKVWSVIRQTEKYSKEGASNMIERFVSRQPINIQSEFLH